jgi:integrase/recombinase XerC
VLCEPFATVFANYEQMITRPGGAPDADSVRVYCSRVRQYLAWLAGGAFEGDPLADPDARDWAARDYRRHLQTVARRKPSTINAHLTAVDDFYRRLGLGPAKVKRAEIPRPLLARVSDDHGLLKLDHDLG